MQFFLWQIQIVSTANPADFIQGDRFFYSFGQHVSLPLCLQHGIAGCFCAFRNQNLPSHCVRFNVGCQIHGVTDKTVPHPHFRTDIAHHNFACIDAYTHFSFRSSLCQIFLIHFRHCHLHFNGTCHSPEGMVFVKYRGTENNKESVSDNFNKGSAISENNLYHHSKICIECGYNILRCQTSAQGGKTAKVAHYDAHLAPLPTDFQTVRGFKNVFYHIMRQITPENFLDKTILFF